MKNLANNSPRPGELLIDLFTGMFAIAKTGLKLPRQCQFMGCKLDHECFLASTETLVERSARQAVSEKWDIFSNDDVVFSCKIVVRVSVGL